MSRFKTSELTLQELNLLSAGSSGDFECIIQFLESRRADPTLDIRNLPLSELMNIMIEMSNSLPMAPEIMPGSPLVM